MKKVLIIADWFAPENEIASIRTTKLAKYLNILGHEITVATKTIDESKIKDSLLEKDMTYLHEVIRTERGMVFRFLWNLGPFISARLIHRERNGNQEAAQESNRSKSKSGFLKPIWQRMTHFVLGYFDKLYSKKVFSTLKNSDYDIVISTYGEFAPHLIAAKLKATHKSKIKWIADFRDPVFSSLRTTNMESDLRGYFKKVAREADAITAVSQGILEVHEQDLFQEGNVITNGFDLDDIKPIAPIKFENEIINFVYVGALYQNKRDFAQFFNTINDLIKSGLFEVNNIAIHYAGRDFEILWNQASKCCLTKILHDHGYLPREQSLALQLGADVLLHASWNATGNTGVNTGKIFEYMMIKKPILSIISGNVPNSEIREMIERANIGLCYEEALKHKDDEKLKEFLIKLYQDFQSGTTITFEPNKKYIEKFDYKNIAKQFEALF